MIVSVAGARGLVGSALCPLLRQRGHAVAEGDLEDSDVTSPARLESWLGDSRPAWVVNLAAWTDVDGCEADPRAAALHNGEGAGNLAAAAAKRGASFLQVSTDYVFDGTKGAPYLEDDPPRPISVYGKSKLEGEVRARREMGAGRLLVVRGQSLYGAGRKSFPDAILSSRKQEIPVVVDQVVSPTWARDFAEGLVLLLEKGARGVFHLSSSGHCSWNEFARAVLAEAGAKGATITDTTAATLGRPAPRPAFSVFDLSRFERETGGRPRPWRDQLRDYLRSTGRAA